ncbi:hypothetical protein GCM10011369_16890 [Neiella marina]|uniref:Uncharacterized protein n=1 Tax=Neiella marina TaxID=508461 RepID=A0A8J2XM59_9GAMM|nr:hypothetical protein GCM10011369_16890 [Neiella marina]
MKQKQQDIFIAQHTFISSKQKQFEQQHDDGSDKQAAQPPRKYVCQQKTAPKTDKVPQTGVQFRDG